ncbi:MAG: haloacid dehalogenase type II [Gemmataceae bacterium]
MSELARQVKVLFFDVFGTVVDWRGSVAREAAAFFAPRGIDRDWLQFAERWRARYQPAMERVRCGERPFVPLDALHRENLLDLLAEFDLHGLQDAEIDQLNLAWHRLDPWPDAVAGLATLKRRFIIAPCSNGNIALMVNMAKRAGLPWDVILGAEVARVYKPQPECYLGSCAALNNPPGEVMMVAAHNDDLRAASRCGLRTAFVARPLEHGPGQRADLKPEDVFDLTAFDFLDLADQLGCAPS